MGILLLIAVQSMAQKAPPQDTTATKVIVKYSDFAEGTRENGEEIRKLNGNVELRQDSIFMSCDTAVMAVAKNNLVAQGSVVIQQGDSLVVYSDSLVYIGNDRIADLYKSVVLKHKDQLLFTDRLNYDLNTKIAKYFEGALLTDGKTQLQSKQGYYYVNTEEAYFKDSVVVVDTAFELHADTLKFNTASKVVTFLGPTRINQNDSKIYCEGGFYDTENSLAEFTDNPQYVKDEQQALADIIRYDGNKNEVSLIGNANFVEGNRRATADRIRYDEKNDITYLEGNAYFEDETQLIDADTIVYDATTKTYATRGRSNVQNEEQLLIADQIDFDDATGLGVATGNVIWEDTINNMKIYCDVINYNKESDYVLATGERPLLTTVLEGDTLYLAADTLIAERADTILSDSSRNLLAYRNVGIFKSDLQAVCDSLVFEGRDSVFTFYDDPLVWSDTTQFSGDTISMILNNGQLDTIFLYKNGFIVNSPDEILFNQIKGRDIAAYFENNDLYKVLVEGNAEFVYYIMDDADAYIAANSAVCSNMVLDFNNNEVERINCFPSPSAKLIPMAKANHEALKLEGFGWEINRRPKSVKDLLKKRKLLALDTTTSATDAASKRENVPLKSKAEKEALKSKDINEKSKSKTRKKPLKAKETTPKPKDPKKKPY